MYLDFSTKILTPEKYTKNVHQKYTKKSTPKNFFNTKNFFSTPKSTPNFGVTPKFSKKNTRNDHQKQNPGTFKGLPIKSVQNLFDDYKKGT